MKKKIFVVVCSLVAALTLSAILVPSEANALGYEKESFLVDDEGKEDGAIYMNEEHSLYCCGSGNVRSCEGYVRCK